jgi:hypothetical protein
MLLLLLLFFVFVFVFVVFVVFVVVVRFFSYILPFENFITQCRSFIR